MLLKNLAEPDWIQIDCDKKYLTNLVCITNETNNSDKKINIDNVSKATRVSCLKTHILKNNVCYLFLWYKEVEGVTMNQMCKNNGAVLVDLKDITMFKYLFEAVSSEFPPILSPHILHKYLYKFTYKRHANIYVYNKEEILADESEGLHLCSAKKKFTSTGDNLFHCQNGSYISYILVCNGVIDCPFDSSDETFTKCTLFSNTQNKQKLFSSCDALFYMTRDKTCIPFLPKENKVELRNYDLMNDLVADDGPKGNDEPELISLLLSNNKTLCALPNQLSCIEGHSKCYNISEICIYTLNSKYQLVPCRNGNHLQCCRDFQCNLMFKCHNSYCIHWAYLNDGK